MSAKLKSSEPIGDVSRVEMPSPLGLIFPAALLANSRYPLGVEVRLDERVAAGITRYSELRLKFAIESERFLRAWGYDRAIEWDLSACSRGSCRLLLKS